MKRKMYVLNALKDLAVFTAETGEMMPEEVIPIAEQIFFVTLQSQNV